MHVDWTTRPLRSCGFGPCAVCRLEKTRKSLRGRSEFIGRLLPMAGFVSARRLGCVEGQAGSWASTETGWQETGLALQDNYLEEPASVEVSIRFVDARNDCGVDLEAVADKVEPRIGWTITGAAWHQLSEAIASCC